MLLSKLTLFFASSFDSSYVIGFVSSDVSVSFIVASVIVAFSFIAFGVVFRFFLSFAIVFSSYFLVMVFMG